MALARFDELGIFGCSKHLLARLRGYLARKGDSPPGKQSDLERHVAPDRYQTGLRPWSYTCG
jgi:hypothetical protein